MISDIFLVCCDKFYYKNRIFDVGSPQNRDHAYDPYFTLQRELQSVGVRLNTYDYYQDFKPEKYALLFVDIPRNLSSILAAHPQADKYLILLETSVIKPANWDMQTHLQFKKIFTWNDELVDGVKYFKSNFPNFFPEQLDLAISPRTKLCTLIAGNKAVRHPLELYSKRIEAIRWFEKHHPDDFDLYGMGWDEYTFQGPLPFRLLNRVKPLRRLLASDYPSYRGTIPLKSEVLRKYKFSICYENVRDLPGYVTEKVFDCFFAGCVPIYWGAGNITDHIGEDCFIDRQKFAGYQELYDYLVTMDDATYRRYLQNIQNYLKSPMSYEYTATYFAATIRNEIT